MLRPANDALKERKVETATTVAVLAFALVIPCLAVLAAAFVGDVAKTYLEAYEPIVYLTADAQEADAKTLAEELGAWPAVGEAKLRTPDEAFSQLQERLGNGEVAKLGVSAKMLPYSVVLQPSTPVAGHLDLIAEISGLEARMEVESVDVPSAQAAKALSFVRWLLWLGAGLLVVLVVTGVSQVRGYLVRLADESTRETELLALFGAPPSKLRRASLVRGVTIGVWAGVVAFAGLFALLLMWQDARPVLVGVAHGASAWSWAVIAAPVIFGPLFGATAGWFANRSRRHKSHAHDLELENLVSLR
jgi:cell division protein FtsX